MIRIFFPFLLLVLFFSNGINAQNNTYFGIYLNAPKTDTLLSGFDNPVQFSASGYSLKYLKAYATYGELKGNGGNYILSIPKNNVPLEITITVNYDSGFKGNQTEIFKRKFHVRAVTSFDLTQPIKMEISLGELKEFKYLSIPELSNQGSVYAIQSFTMVYIPKNKSAITLQGKGSEISMPMKNIISQGEKGDKILFMNIRYSYPDGKVTTYPRKIELDVK